MCPFCGVQQNPTPKIWVYPEKVNIVRLAKFAISLGPSKLTVTVQIIITIRIVVKSLSPESQNGKNIKEINLYLGIDFHELL